MPTVNPQERGDGRKSSQIRTLSCERGLLNRADGSARWTQGSSAVLAAVYGPHSIVSRKEDPERAVIEVNWRPGACAQGQKERIQEAIIRRTVEAAVLTALAPRTAVRLILQVLVDDGSIVAAALNASCMALVDAGVPMKHMFVSVVSAVCEGGVLLLDITATEEKEVEGHAVLCYAVSGSLLGDGKAGTLCSNGVLSMICEGCMSPEAARKLTDAGRVGCERIATFMRSTIQKAYGDLAS